jgi:uncharacterized protein DUF1501
MRRHVALIAVASGLTLIASDAVAPLGVYSPAERLHAATDDIGLKAVQDPVHLRDLHTTLLYQLGLNPDALSYLHQGRRERLTEVHGTVIQKILA